MRDRRDFFKKVGLLGLSTITTRLFSNEKLQIIEKIGNQASDTKSFLLPKLPFTYNALEPFIDEQTMVIHHTKHHQGYIDKLNALPSSTFDFTVDDITKCRKLDLEAKANLGIRNNLGGHVNHSIFWTLLKSNPKSEINLPNEKLGVAISSHFKSFDEFKKQFSDAAVKHFGSGWCWLVIQNGVLKIVTTPNQDNPYMTGVVSDKKIDKVILALDVWEHAYYLKYQNKRVEYINNWWNIVNWEMAESLYLSK